MIHTRSSRVLQAAAVLALLNACNGEAPETNGMTEQSAGEESSAKRSSGEWVELFNGHDLTGWRSYDADVPKPGWVVEDGAIVLDVDEPTTEMTGGDLLTVDEYENFELELEWKISEGGNSGIFYGVREIPGIDVAYMTGIEMQVLDNDRHPDGKEPKTSAGACYALYAPTAVAVRPVGEYNKVRIIVNDGHVEYWLNGQHVVEYVIGSDDWNQRVADSKFADWEHFAKYRKGHIGLQDHSDRVWFRNIRIRQL